jgi:hypothetical protein
MDLPFTTAEFLTVFQRYNEAIWPIHVVAHGLGPLTIALALRPRGHSERLVAGILALFWVGIGGVRHLAFFREINPIAAV